MKPKLIAQQRVKLVERELTGEPVNAVCREAGVSRVLFYRWIKRYKTFGVKGLAPISSGRPRKSRTPKYLFPKELLPLERFRMCEEVLSKQRSAASVAKEYGVSRVTLYKWIRRCKLHPEARINAVKDKIRHIDRYWRQAPDLYAQAVCSLVANHPEWGIRRLVANLPKIGAKPILGHHGVQNVLRRAGLLTVEKRFAYAQDQITPIVSIITSVLSQASRLFAIPLIPRTRIVRFASVAGLSTLVTVLLLGSVGLFTTSFAGVSFTTRAGLAFAYLALICGTFFLLYSMKYYITLAVVLSFSQSSVNSDQSAVNGRKKGLLSWILGNLRPESKAKSFAAGLTPDLSHITLEKYPFISVHIPFYNEKKVVERSIQAAVNFDYKGDYEVILCDDSTDETTQIIANYLKSQAPNIKSQTGDDWKLTQGEVRPGVVVKHIHRSSRAGFKGGALELARKLTDPRAEFVSVFDADFVPYPDTLTLFLKYFKASTDTKVAAVQGYQWHVLNNSENWITRGVRSEYSGSYVIERSGTELYGGLKQISGSVYMIRKDILDSIGWGTSITEDFELTLKLYEKGYKVVYTPYIQAPSECVSTIKRLVRQRMRWAEGHSYNIRRMFPKLITNPNLTTSEKLEFLYLSPYYLQAFFFLIGTISWLISETIFPARLPFWTALWGWSLVLTNMISLPLMNAVGMFLEESEHKDYQGILSFVILSYLVVPFQAYAAVKGFLEQSEGPWFRTPKTGRITDIFRRASFFRWIGGILPGKVSAVPNLNLNLAGIKPSQRKVRWATKALIVVMLIISLNVSYLALGIGVSNNQKYWGNRIAKGAPSGSVLGKEIESTIMPSIAQAAPDKTTELVARRTQNSKTFINPDGTFTTQSKIGPLHYQDESGNWQNVDATPVRVIESGFDGWEITNNGFYFRLGSRNGTDGWIGYGGKRGQHWLWTRAVRAGYLHWSSKTWQDVSGTPSYNQADLTRATSQFTGADGVASNIGGNIIWPNIWPGGNLEWILEGGRLKENIRVSETTRNNLPPPQRAANQTWFGFVFQVDWSDIPQVFRAGVLQDKNSDFEDSGEQIELRNAAGEILGILPQDTAVVENPSKTDPAPKSAALRKRFWQDTAGDLGPAGNYYLLLGSRSDQLNQLQAGAIIFDPTVTPTIAETNEDGNSDCTNENVLPSQQAFGQMYIGDDAGTCATRNIDGGWIFETTVPQAAVITSCTITLTNGSDNNVPVNGGWYGFAVDSPSDFSNSDAHRISDHHTRTTATVTSTISSTGNYTSDPDLSTICQEMTDRPGYTGRLGITWRNSSASTNNWYEWQDYTEGAAGAADLSVTYHTYTAYSNSAKSFYDSTNGIYWSFWYDGDSIEGWYSGNDGSTWTAADSPTDIAVDTTDFSLWHIPGDTYVYIAYVSNFDVLVRRGTLSSTDITWGTAGTALNGASATDQYRRPFIARDDSGFLHVVGKYITSSNYYMRASRCGTADTPDTCTWT